MLSRSGKSEHPCFCSRFQYWVDDEFVRNSIFFFLAMLHSMWNLISLTREKAQISALLPESHSSRDQLGFQPHFHFQKWCSQTSRTCSRSTTAAGSTLRRAALQGPPSPHVPLYFCPGPRLILCMPLGSATSGCLHAAHASPLSRSVLCSPSFSTWPLHTQWMWIMWISKGQTGGINCPCRALCVLLATDHLLHAPLSL